MSEFRYPLPNGDEFLLNIILTHWTDPEILKLLERIKHTNWPKEKGPEGPLILLAAA